MLLNGKIFLCFVAHLVSFLILGMVYIVWQMFFCNREQNMYIVVGGSF